MLGSLSAALLHALGTTGSASQSFPYRTARTSLCRCHLAEAYGKLTAGNPPLVRMGSHLDSAVRSRSAKAKGPFDDEEYEESAAERDARLLFDSSPFRTAESTVGAIMGCTRNHIPPLRRMDPANQKEKNEDGFESLFSTLFVGMPCKSRDNTIAAALPSSSNQPAFFKKRQNFKIQVAYKGRDFCGWQIQFDNPKPSVQQSLIDILDPHLQCPPVAGSKRAAKRANKPLKPLNIRVCGRTDAGVSAVGQVCRVRTFHPESDGVVNAGTVQEQINQSPLGQGGSLRCMAVEAVDESFHPTFGATCRAYSYLIDLEEEGLVGGSDESSGGDDDVTTLRSTHLPLLDAMLRRLEGCELDYYAFSYGKVKTSTTLCTLHRSRASLVESMVPADTQEGKGVDSSKRQKALCIELIGNRFLRRMVRILVATAVRETLRISREHSHTDLAGCVADAENTLLQVCQQGKREISAKAAPPFGLIFVGAKFNASAQSV